MSLLNEYFPISLNMSFKSLIVQWKKSVTQKLFSFIYSMILVVVQKYCRKLYMQFDLKIFK